MGEPILKPLHELHSRTGSVVGNLPGDPASYNDDGKLSLCPLLLTIGALAPRDSEHATHVAPQSCS